MPPNYAIKLIDQNTGIATDLRQSKIVRYISGEQASSRSFQLVVGEAEFIEQNTPVPVGFELSQNFPNPFNSVTTIQYVLPEESKISLKIYNLNGEEIRTLVDHESKSVGYHEISWDGKNKAGELVATGVYFYRIHTNDGFSRMRKLVYLK